MPVNKTATSPIHNLCKFVNFLQKQKKGGIICPSKIEFIRIQENPENSPRYIAHFLFLTVQFIRGTICKMKPFYDGDILTIIGHMALISYYFI